MCVYIYIYIYICICICMYVCVYIYICECVYILFVVCSLCHSYPWHIAIVFSSPIVDILT